MQLARTRLLFLLLPRHRLPDIADRLRRLAVGLAVVDLHPADARRGGLRLLLEGGIADADRDQGIVHLVADAVGAAVDVALDGGEESFEIFVGQAVPLPIPRDDGQNPPAGRGGPPPGTGPAAA